MRSGRLILLLSLLVFGSSCASAQNAPVASQYFYNQATFPTTSHPGSVAIADLNGDGRPDLIVGSADGDNPTLSILLGQPDATFGAKTDISSPAGASAGVTAADLNGDGKIDFVVTGQSGVAIALGNGDGTFQPAVLYPLADGTFGVTLQLADVNHDGRLDLVTVSRTNDGSGDGYNTLVVLLGKGDGTFQTLPAATFTGLAAAYAVADLNGDGKPDLALAVPSSTNASTKTASVVLRLGNGDGTFQAPVSYSSANDIGGIAVGDVTGDKVPDLIVTHYFSPQVTLYKGNGDGTFQAEQVVSDEMGLGAIAQLTDLNHDGKLDLLLGNGLNSGISVLLGNGDGTFQTPLIFWAGQSPATFTFGDTNGDGNLDLVVPDQIANTVTVLLGNGDGTFSPKRNLLPPGQDSENTAVVGDFNGDGTPDVVFSTGSTLSVLLGQGKGVFAQPVTTPLTDPGNHVQISAGDFNRDGHLDLIVGGSYFYAGRGDGTFAIPRLVSSALANTPTDTRSFAVGDFNGDGILDLLVVGNGFTQSQPLKVLLGNGDGSFQAPSSFWNQSAVPDEVVAADFNHDGKLDIAVTLNPSGVAVMLGDGHGGFAAPVTVPTDALPNGIAVADLNGDGIPDLVASAFKIDPLLGKGDGTFTPLPYITLTDNGFPFGVAAGDLNGDGKADLVIPDFNSATGALAVLLGNGDGTFASSLTFIDQGGLPASFPVADLNGDGIDDIVVSAGPGSVFFSAPLASFSPSPLNLGVLKTGASASADVTVTNSGNAPLTITGATASAPFTVGGSGCPSALKRLASCQIPITFSAAMPGTAAGALTVTDSGSPLAATVPLSATVLTPTLTVSPAALTFAAEATGVTSAAQTVTITNTSVVPASLGAVAATGPFAVTSQCGATLSPNSTCTLSITFAPTTTGQQTGTVTLADDAAGSPQSIALTGAGDVPLSIGPQSAGGLTTSVTSGSTATFALSLAAGPGFSGAASLTCTGAPANATCTVNPAGLTLTAGGTGAFTATVTTSPQASAAARITGTLQFASIGCLVAACFLPSRSRRLGLRALLLALTMTGLCAGCSNSPARPPAVAPGTYALQVTATVGKNSTSQTLTLIVR